MERIRFRKGYFVLAAAAALAALTVWADSPWLELPVFMGSGVAIHGVLAIIPARF